MKALFHISLTLLLLQVNLASAQNLEYKCDFPFWSGASESHDGVFTGDLSLNCSVNDERVLRFSAFDFKTKVIEKIQSESVVNTFPESNPSTSSSPLTWDVTHRFKEEGNTVEIREFLTLSSETVDHLKYQTRSKEVKASGMAGYLRSVEFTMTLHRSGKDLKVSFRNKVQVDRPWFALDLVFAPIARKTCFKKLDQVKEKFMPWVLDHLNGHKEL